MTGVLSALAPVFGLIAVGYLLKSRRIFTDDFWDPAERLTFYLLFPALLITSIGGAEAVGERFPESGRSAAMRGVRRGIARKTDLKG